MLKTVFILAAAAALTAPAAAEPAVSAATAHVRQVSWTGLDLESSDGRALLERRLNRAVKSVCSVDGAPASQALLAEQARCVTETSAAIGGHVDAAIVASRASRTSFASNN